LDQVLSQREIVALTSLFIAMIGYGIIFAFALESLKTGEVWGVEKTYTRAKQPSRFWLHMSVYGSTLTLAGVVFGTALQELVG
jgi:hypothetical protein